MADIYVSAGSNIEPEKNLTAGLKLLMHQADVLRISTHYRNTPAGARNSTTTLTVSGTYSRSINRRKSGGS